MASINKRPKGKWRARWREYPGGPQKTRQFDRKVDARAWIDAVTAGQVRGDYVDPHRSRLTVGQWSARWLETRVHLKPKTLASYRSLLTTRVLPEWQDVPLAAVSNSRVVAWVAAMRADGLSASRVRQSYHLLTSMLDAAVRDRRLASNPAADVSLPRMPRKEQRYLTYAQVAELADACGPYRVLVLVLAYCGLRWGEAAALRVRNVDVIHRRIRVVEAVTEINGRLVVGSPKTHQERTVPVPAFVGDMLVEHLAGASQGGLAFTSPRGETLRVGNFRRGWFDRATGTLGIEGLVPHELRHTAASLAIAAGASVKGVQMMLGHASATLTLDLYGHLFPDELEGVAERLDVAAARSAEDSLRTKQGSRVVRMPSRKAK